MSLKHTTCVTLGFLALLGIPTQAEWSPDPLVHNAVSIEMGEQTRTRQTTDGAGGTILVWQDSDLRPERESWHSVSTRWAAQFGGPMAH